MARDFDDLRARAQGALEKWKAAQAKIAKRDNLPAAGDIYVFSATAEIGVEWVMVLQHVDDAALWFMVPFDQSPMVGTWDVPVSESSDTGPGTIRCGCGIWIHVDDLAIGSRSGFLESWYIEKAKSQLAAMVTTEGDEQYVRPDVDDDDPDYQEWLDEVTAAAERLESQLREVPEVISVAAFDTNWAETLRSKWYHASDMSMLVAESSGLGSLPEQKINPLPGYLMAERLPGNLVAVHDGAVVRLLYYPAGYENAPEMKTSSEGVVKPLVWRVLPDGVAESAEGFSANRTVVHLPSGTKKVLSFGV